MGNSSHWTWTFCQCKHQHRLHQLSSQRKKRYLASPPGTSEREQYEDVTRPTGLCSFIRRKCFALQDFRFRKVHKANILGHQRTLLPNHSNLFTPTSPGVSSQTPWSIHNTLASPPIITRDGKLYTPFNRRIRRLTPSRSFIQGYIILLGMRT